MRNRRAVSALAVALTLASFVAACEQPAADVEPGNAAPAAELMSTSSVEARAALMAAFDDWFNVFAARAYESAANAVAIDSSFGFARALSAFLAPNLTDEETEAEFDRAVTDAAADSPAELAMAASLRARAAGDLAEARGFADVAVALVPNDPNVLFFRAFGLPGGADQLESMMEITERFPDFAAAFNIRAYLQWAEGDTADALAAVERYVELKPSHPNAHDSFAELLQFAGRFDEALEHYQQAIALDENYLAGYTGVGEVNALMGNGEEARAAFMEAADRSPTPAARLNNLAIRAVLNVVSGTPADAVRELMDVARQAQAADVPALAAAAHRNAALIEAVLGNPASAAGHLTGAARIIDPPPLEHQRISAIALALAGQSQAAQDAAARYEEVAATGPEGLQAQAHEVRAIIAVAQNDLATARTELDQADSALLGKAVLADALAASGDAAGAQALKDEVSADTGVTLFAILARAKVRS